MPSSQLSLESIMRACEAGAAHGLVAKSAIGEPGTGVPLRAKDSGVSVSKFNPDGSLMEPVALEGATRRPKLTEAVQRDYENDGVSVLKKVAGSSELPYKVTQWLADNLKQSMPWQNPETLKSMRNDERPFPLTWWLRENVRQAEHDRLEREMEPYKAEMYEMVGGRNDPPPDYIVQAGREKRQARIAANPKNKDKPMGRTGWAPAVTGGIVLSMLGLVGGSAMYGRSQARKKLEAIRSQGGSGDSVSESLKRMDRARDVSLRRQGDGESK